MSDYFINESGLTKDPSKHNYWEPHTASIDFCESNYLLSSHVVEPHNVWSSLLGLSLFGILGIVYGNPTKEWRTNIAYTVLVGIGLGSAALHATLHWAFQSADELPMIYLVICAAYLCLEVDAPRMKPNYPRLPAYLMLLTCINTLIYYTFQHLYAFFLATFVSMLLLLIYLHVKIAWKLISRNKNGLQSKNNSKNDKIALRFYLWHYITFVGLASPIWVLDQFYCQHLLPFYNDSALLPWPLQGMTLHVVWHICAGMGAHCLMQFLCACRATTLGIRCDSTLVMGFLPVVVAVDDNREGEGTTRMAGKKQT